MSSSKMLITGAGGMLGSELGPALTSLNGSERVVSLSREDLDITDAGAVAAALDSHRPEWIFNAAAYTQVDAAEKEIADATKLNAEGPAILAEACRKKGTRLFHFGTDQVFDGTKDSPWTEEDAPNPLNVYARTKLAGERAVLAASSQNIVMRVQWLYGRKKDRFTILRDKEVFRPFNDQIGAPNWASHVALTAGELAQNNSSGLFHFAYDDFGSWAEVYALVKEIMSYRVRLEPVTTASMNLPARRPLNCSLSNRKLLEALGRPSMGSWRLALMTFLSGVRH